jgi:hypothetical protein
VKASTDPHSKAVSLHRLAFDDVVSGLLKVKSQRIPLRGPARRETRPNKARKGSRRKE